MKDQSVNTASTELLKIRIKRTAEFLGKDYNDLEDHRMPYGKWCFPFRCKERQMCVDTSMGLTRSKGVIMGDPFRRYRSGFC